MQEKLRHSSCHLDSPSYRRVAAFFEVFSNVLGTDRENAAVVHGSLVEDVPVGEVLGRALLRLALTLHHLVPPQVQVNDGRPIPRRINQHTGASSKQLIPIADIAHRVLL